MDDDARSGVHTVTADDVPFEVQWVHWSTLRTWPIHLAVAWAAYPSRAEIVRQGQRPTTFPRERAARAEVVAALIAGRLVAYGVKDPGMPWDPAVEIPAERWRALDLRDSRTLSEPALDRGNRGAVEFRSVEVETSRLFGIWPDPEVTPAPETPIEVEFAEVIVDEPEQESEPLPPPLTRQDIINGIAVEIPDGFRWEVGSDNKEPGSPRDYPFYRELEKKFGGPISRDDEALPAWNDHYPFKPRRGRPRKSEQK